MCKLILKVCVTENYYNTSVTTAEMASFDFDAVVYGAGPVGAAVALGLQQRGHRVVVLEKRTEYQVIGDAGKSINLSLSTRGNALMKQLGVYDGLLSTLVPMVSRIFAGASASAPIGTTTRSFSCLSDQH